MSTLSDFQIAPFVEAALREDIRSGDITTNAIFPVDAQGQAQMRMREDGVLSGVDAARLAFETLGDVRVETSKNDGDELARGDVALTISGSARTILSAERVALNFAQR